MGERLGRKLDAMQDGASPKAQRPCVEVDESFGFAASFHLREGRVFVLPYHSLAHATAAANEAVDFVFSSHAVHVEGERLKPLLEAIARGRNVSVRVAPADRKGSAKNEPVVREISVVESGAEPGDDADART